MPQDNLLRLEERAGESRTNVIRVVALTLFFGQHVVRYLFWNDDGGISSEFHQQVTSITIFWGLSALAIFVALQREAWLPWLKYAAVAGDVIGVTCLSIATRSPNGTFVPLYFLVIASAPLRLSLRLVYFATISSALGYLAYLATYAWVQIGAKRYYSQANLRVPPSHEILTVLALIIAGLLAGQMVRQFYRSRTKMD
jgi:hypothetical protein